MKLALLLSGLVAGCLHFSAFAAEPTQPVPDVNVLVTDKVIANLREIILDDVIQISVKAQNSRRGSIEQARVDELDKEWRAETKSTGKQPLIARTLSNPASAQLLRIQARSLGLYSEMFVMDAKGLNVGQSSITSDYWQGDEAKFQKTFPVGPSAIFIDEPEWHEETGTWRVQVNMTIPDGKDGGPIGAATFEINLTELQRRMNV
ncbi:hypothetical protein C8N35_1011569 [Breoghania corrubedonensis]|uniref:DUF3859 domain-containing protein n=1 Tax=Breoghania corrubedonensis TaxID=665038 RepID=A0A2T5VIC5_9HYPH|nr:hypothetical protein [Breoghania corrubedonensis]PTW63515.1 hypothetical protein C8N35_1011569 [Breoghania corrubedonensis]